MMSQKDERQKAIERCRKYASQTVERGQSEASAELAMRKMGELMDAFDITLDEISLAEQECKKVEVKLEGGRAMRMPTVTFAIGKFCDCLSYITKGSKQAKRDKDGNVKYGGKWKDAYGRVRAGRIQYEPETYTLHYFGLVQDAETAGYLLELCREALRSSIDQFKKTETYKTYQGSKLSLTKSFIEGFNDRLTNRLNDMKDERDEELERARQAREEMGEGNLDAERAAAERRAGRSTDLVALKHKKVEDDFKKSFGWVPRSGTHRSGAGRYTGRLAGRGAAERVNLSRPVGGGGYSGQLRLGSR